FESEDGQSSVRDAEQGGSGAREWLVGLSPADGEDQDSDLQLGVVGGAEGDGAMFTITLRQRVVQRGPAAAAHPAGAAARAAGTDGESAAWGLLPAGFWTAAGVALLSVTVNAAARLLLRDVQLCRRDGPEAWEVGNQSEIGDLVFFGRIFGYEIIVKRPR
ncbi:MAG: hypothetical protein BJ554DRAFT_6299, partial [Olpidium bornovanus]